MCLYIINREIHRRVSSKVKQFLFDGGDEIKTGKEKLNKFTILANAAMYHKLQLKTEKSNNQCLRIFLFVWKKLYTFLQLRPKFIDQSLFIISGGGGMGKSHMVFGVTVGGSVIVNRAHRGEATEN